MKTRILDRTAVTFDNVLSLVLIALVPETLVGGDLFQDNGAFTPTVTKDSVDTARSLAYPGGELPKLGVIRTDRQGQEFRTILDRAAKDPDLPRRSAWLYHL